MSTEPMTLAARRAKRAKIRGDRIAAAEREALTRHRSLKCAVGLYSEPRHASEPDGCRNDGSGCLCECHDPPS